MIGLAFLFGALFWTLAEYGLHRGLGHRRGARNPFSREHVAHHATITYFAPTSKKLVLLLLILAAPALGWLLGALGVALSLGFVVMYVGYELIHRRLHTHEGRTRYGRWARRHHFHHHFSKPHTNHGVTSPLWDWIFGTLEVPGQVQVPKRNALPWMLDERGGLKPALAGEYHLGRAPALKAAS